MYPYIPKGTVILVFAATVVREPTVNADPEQAVFSLCGLRPSEMQSWMQMNDFPILP